MKSLKHIFIAIGIIISCITVGNSQGQSNATPDIYQEFDTWLTWIGQSGEYDPVFQRNINGLCCKDLTLLASQMGPSINYLINESANIDVKVLEMRVYLNKLDDAQRAGNKAAVTTLILDGFGLFVSYKGLYAIKDISNLHSVQKFAFDTSSEALVDGVKDFGKEKVDEIINNSQAIIENKPLAEIDAITTKIDKQHETEKDVLKYTGWFLHGSAVVLSFACPPAALAATVIAGTFDAISILNNWSISNEQMTAVGKLMKNKENMITNYHAMLISLSRQQNALVRQRDMLRNMCGETTNGLRLAPNNDGTSTTYQSYSLQHSTLQQQSDSNPNSKDAINMEVVGLEETITIYPNPTNSEVYINLSSFQGKKAKLYLHDAFGKQVLSKSLSTGDINSINVGHYDNGTYWVTIYLPEQQLRTTQQLIITK